jgi:hypothetical protein
MKCLGKRIGRREDEAMKCREFEKYGMLYLYHELSPAEKECMEDHLRDCQECRDEIHRATELRGLASKLPVMESPPPSTEVIAALSEVGRRRSLSFMGFNLRYVLAACAAIILVAAGFLLSAHHMPDSGEKAAVRELGAAVWSDNEETALTEIDGQVQQFTISDDSYYSLSNRIERRRHEDIVTQVRSLYAWEEEIGQLRDQINGF